MAVDDGWCTTTLTGAKQFAGIADRISDSNRRSNILHRRPLSLTPQGGDVVDCALRLPMSMFARPSASAYLGSLLASTASHD